MFQDVESIRPAENWFDTVHAALQRANFILVVIGPSWLDAVDAQGRRRLDDSNDLVRLEVVTALRGKKTVIPVLVGDAKMPPEPALPNDIKPLVHIQAVRLTDQHWRDDIQHLFATLASGIWLRRALLASAGMLQITFIGLWIYTNLLENHIARDEARSAVIRDAYIAKMQGGSDECMAGTWPEGAIKGPTYQKNGHQVTELCSGVSGSLNYFGQFFNDDRLWRLPPSSETADKFTAVFGDTFDRNFEAFLSSSWTSPLSEAALMLARRARAELAVQGKQVVALKRAAGSAAERLQILQPAITLGKFWTLLAAAALVVWLVRGRRRFVG